MPAVKKQTRKSYLSNPTKSISVSQQNDINPSIVLLMLIPSNNSEFSSRRELH